VRKSNAPVAPNVAPRRLAISRNILTVDDTQPILSIMSNVVVFVVGGGAVHRTMHLYIHIYWHHSAESVTLYV
jgi:hypothetical protein